MNNAREMNVLTKNDRYSELLIAAAVGIVIFAGVSWITGGLFPFIEVAIAAVAAYITARR